MNKRVNLLVAVTLSLAIVIGVALVVIAGIMWRNQIDGMVCASDTDCLVEIRNGGYMVALEPTVKPDQTEDGWEAYIRHDVKYTGPEKSCLVRSIEAEYGTGETKVIFPPDMVMTLDRGGNCYMYLPGGGGSVFQMLTMKVEPTGEAPSPDPKGKALVPVAFRIPRDQPMGDTIDVKSNNPDIATVRFRIYDIEGEHILGPTTFYWDTLSTQTDRISNWGWGSLLAGMGGLLLLWFAIDIKRIRSLARARDSATPSAEFRPRRTMPRSSGKSAQVTCPNDQCNYVGPAARHWRGCRPLALVLFVMYLIPGVVYMMLVSTYQYSCPKCGIFVGSNKDRAAGPHGGGEESPGEQTDAD